MVAVSKFPSLERKPGGPNNWIEEVGGLPQYIDRIARHLHYEKGMDISHAIATAVNTVKRWSHKGGVVKYGDKNHKHVTVITAAQAAADLAEWERKKAQARALRAARKAKSLSVEDDATQVDLARGMTKDGRPSFKGQGKWKHGFIPADEKAVQAKAKGSPIATKRIHRIYGGVKAAPQGKVNKNERQVRRARVRKELGKFNPQDHPVTIGGSKSNVTERVQSLGQARHLEFKDANKSQRVKLQGKEASKGGDRVKRSNKPWNEIPESQKIEHNGKRYVLTTFNGKQLLTEYVGPTDTSIDQADPAIRRMGSASVAELIKMTPGQLRKLLDVPGQPANVRKAIYQAIKEQQKRKEAGIR